MNPPPARGMRLAWAEVPVYTSGRYDNGEDS